MINKIWHKLSTLGVDESDEFSYREIILLNKVIVVGLIMVLGFIPIEIILNGLKLVPIEVFSGVLFSFILYFNYKRWYNLAKYYSVIYTSLIIVLMTYMVGGGSNSEFLLIALVPFPMLLFKNRTHIILLSLFIASTFFFIKYNVDNTKAIVYVEDSVKAKVQPIFIGMSMVLLFFQVYYFRNLNTTFEKILIQKKEDIQKKHREIQDSINYAQRIQSSLLPSEEMFKKIFPESFILFKPKDIVSGDFYWLSDRDDYVFYATADCTGHGVPGGFMSMLGTALLNEIIDERKISDCGEVLNLMREKITNALKQSGEIKSKDGMDMVLIRINKKTLQMQYAAANNSFYIVKNNLQLDELPCDKMPVGVYHGEVRPFKTFEIQLSKDDIIYTFTDGYADQFGGSENKKFMKKNFKNMILSLANVDIKIQKIKIEETLNNWMNKGSSHQIDDISVIGVKIL